MVAEDQLKTKLKEVFGYGQFRGNQEPIIHNIMAGNNTFVIMPTGAGKSLCYQLPAIIQDGLAIVISPLIALMKNQVDQLNAFGVSAKFLNSTLSKSESTRIKKASIAGEIKLLYVAPESLTKEENVEFFKKVNISFVAIDEAHCISEWGHDFRPEYRKIRTIISHIGDFPIIALTATATPKVQQDIIRNLGMEGSDVFLSSFNRTNLHYEVRPKQQAKKQLVRLVKEFQGKCGIVYCLSRKKVQEIADLLRVNGFNAAPYHAGLEAAVRMKNQDDFLNENLDIIVATIAFGMGIDKPDVRFVVHYDVPKSLEGYYQETGRAGRDGINGKCVMFYSHNDLNKLEKFNKDKPVTEKENARLLLMEMAYYAESPVCRRKQLLHYFGETYEPDNCGMCDNCTNPREQFEAMEYAAIGLKAVQQTGERFGINHLTDVIHGAENQHVKSYEHDKIEIYGAGKDAKPDFWKSILRQLLIFEYLEKDIEHIGVLKLSNAGRAFIKKPMSVTFSKENDYSNLGEEEEASKDTFDTRAYDVNLFSLLKKLRKHVADEKDLPPFVIFQDPSLEEMATTYPTTREELAQVNGVGMGKVSKFGSAFIDVIKTYVEENDITTAADVMIKTSAQKSRMKVFIIQQIDRKIDLDEIAETKGISMNDLMVEIENICYSGTKLNLDYYIDQILDDEKQDDIFDYFLNAESDSITEALEDEDNADFSEEELRLMRIKFMSEYAN